MINFSELVNKQREFYLSGITLDVKYRLNALKKIFYSIKRYEKDILKALKLDLGKSELEGYMCEIGMALSEIEYMIKNTKKFSKKRKVKTPLAQFPSKSYVLPCPYGNTLIMSPWNYPFLLTIDPLVTAIAAGNTAIVKPSAYSPATSEIICKIIHECFEESYVAVVTGGRTENSELLKQKFDFIFFTGSQNVGKEVLRNAAEHLTPAVLELGGKSPCIVDKTANIPLAAKRIVFGKFLNCGQTWVAPDYILCDKSIKEELLNELKMQIAKQYGDNPLENENYGKIISKKHYDRVCSLIEQSKVVFGGKTDDVSLKIEPTVMDNVNIDDAVMGEEIFGPVLPILTYDSFGEIFPLINNGQKPLALYFFSEDRTNIKAVTEKISYGGGCINDVIIHLATSEMGFGGVGESGMGAYHGKVGFDTFSHLKSIVNKSTRLDLPMRYQPYTDKKEKLIRKFLK